MGSPAVRFRRFSRGLILAWVLVAFPSPAWGGGRWSAERAAGWSKGQPWFVGCNFSPSTAINQLEMWQAETFDLPTIDRELGWAEDLGFNSVRVFLHHLLWDQDRDGFLKRLDQFLAVAEKHKIGVMFVLFDSVWDPFPKVGPQRAPQPGLHNSGWVQSPGVDVLKNPERHGEVEGYVKGVVGRFKGDRRVQVWDLVNEPDNRNTSSYGRHEPENKAELAVLFLKKVFAWTREVGPAQPLTAGVWQGEWELSKLNAVNKLMLDESDVVSFHSYEPLERLKRRVEVLKGYGRPLLCTEYMARPAGSRFDPCLGYLRDEKVGAYNWGFVAGKTQTIYPWETWRKPLRSEPPVWFHDVFRRDGTPHDPAEVVYIKKVTGTLRP